MKLENQVCSLELAKKLKELGVKQESIFAWAKQCVGTHPKTHENIWGYGVIPNTFQAEVEYISAFTVAELGEMLPEKFVTQRIDTKIPYYLCWCLDYEDANSYTSRQIDAITEADARAKMLIYLLENKLIKL